MYFFNLVVFVFYVVELHLVVDLSFVSIRANNALALNREVYDNYMCNKV